MGFLVTTLYYILAGLIGTVGIRVWYDKGPAANRMHILLVCTAVVCCYSMWAIVYLAQYRPLVVPIMDEE